MYSQIQVIKNTDRIVIQKIAQCIMELGGESDIAGTVASWKVYIG